MSASQFSNPAQRQDAATLGMWVFLATELMFFGPLFLGYAYGRWRFPEAFAAAARHTDFALGTANTAILLSSSFLMAFAVEAAGFGARRLARALLVGTAVLGIAFLAVKGFEYAHEWREHLFPVGEVALNDGGRFFFLLYFAMTGVHALHLAIGIAIVLFFAATARRAPKNGVWPERLRVAGLYWHFVDAIWIFLYPMLYLLGRST